VSFVDVVAEFSQVALRIVHESFRREGLFHGWAQFAAEPLQGREGWSSRWS
jgi:hypothetical protein